MSKAILVIDMPSCCRECPVCASYSESALSPREYWCSPMDNQDVKPNSKPDWCPLKSVERLISFNGDEYAEGWNDCIERIFSKT